MNIYFIRHGDPDYDHDCLTPLGHEQAKKLAETVKNFPLKKVFLSPQGRAQQTGGYSLEYFDIEPTTYPWMREIEWGDLSGNAYSTASPWSIMDDMMAGDGQYPLGDSWKTDPRICHDRIVGDVAMRVEKLDELLAELGLVRNGVSYKVTKDCDYDVAIFAHGGVTCAFVSHLLNIPFWQYVAHFPMAMTGIHKIAIEGNVGDNAIARVCFLNDDHHLQDN